MALLVNSQLNNETLLRGSWNVSSEVKKPGDGTVGKALEVLDQVANIGRPVRFSELLEKSDFPKATLYRFLQTLTNQKLLSYDSNDQTYRLGLRLVQLAHAAMSASMPSITVGVTSPPHRPVR